MVLPRVDGWWCTGAITGNGALTDDVACALEGVDTDSQLVRSFLAVNKEVLWRGCVGRMWRDVCM